MKEQLSQPARRAINPLNKFDITGLLAFNFKSNKITTAFLLVVILLIVGLGWWLEIFQDTPAKIVNEPGGKVLPYARPLDGYQVANLNEVYARPVAIVLDNHFDARPQVGMAEASLVYETIAEGAITRLLAIFTLDSLPEKIGPIRSLRPYFISWANEVDAVIIHVGGSPDALNEVKNYNNLNEFFDGIYFYRDKIRTAPHNVFSSRDFLRQGIYESGYATSTNISSWHFASSTSAVVSQTNLTVNFSSAPYNVTWQYQPADNNYSRLVGEREAMVRASNIIVQVVPAEVLDQELRRRLYLVGEGKAWIFSQGKMTVGFWKKTSAEARTRFFDSQGGEVSFRPGPTWVEVIDDEGRLSLN